MRRISTVLAASALATLAAVPAAGQEPAGCTAMFPTVSWDLIVDTGPVLVSTTGIADALAERYVRELAAGAELIQSELGGLDGAEVCLFVDELPLDAVALGWPEGQRLRAASFGAERTLVLSAWNIGLVEPAGVLGLAHLAQYGLMGTDYPEPIGDSVRNWYVDRRLDRVANHHSVMRYANLVRSIPEGIPWTGATIDPVMLWNPEFQESAIGDFADFVAAQRGVTAFLEPDGADLAQLQEEWQHALLVEARGSEEPTRGWIVGLAAIVSILLLAGLVAWVEWSRRREHSDSTPKTLPIADEPTPVGSGAERGS